MPDHEFENYLTLISRFLRLSPAQREAIGEELRDHFESRLTELINAGKSHDEAVRLALAEFGDAAGLAAEFSHISQARRRRLVMRCTVASVAALAAAVFVAMAVWPDHHGRVVRDAMADNAAKTPEKTAAGPIPTADSMTAETEARLEEFLTAEYNNVPLNEFLASVCDKLKIQFILDRPALRDATIDPATAPVDIKLQHVRAKMLLELALGEFNLNYVVDDGILRVSTMDKLNSQLITRVYDCRAILNVDPKAEPIDKRDANGAAFRQSAFDGEASSTNGTRSLFQLIQASPPVLSPAKQSHASTPAEKLIDVICTTIASPTWSSVGGQGTICEYNGLLVVSQTQEVQQQVADLLEQIAGKLAATAKK